MTKHKQPLLLLILCAMLWSVSANAGWWGNNNDQQQIDRLNGEVDQQRQTNGAMGVVIVVLAVGTVSALVIGAAVGSRTRRHAARSHEQ